MTIEELADRAHAANVKRGKVTEWTSRAEFARAIGNEIIEFGNADSLNADKHLPQYSEPTVELADVIIAALSAFRALGYDWEAIEDKIAYNENRED